MGRMVLTEVGSVRPWGFPLTTISQRFVAVQDADIERANDGTDDGKNE